MKPTCKILISYHKKDFLLKDDILTPIHAGRAIALKQSGSSSLEWLLSNMEGDNTGDNISEKNGSYNELTTIYWAWKNYDADYYGLCHYRRYLSFMDSFMPGNDYDLRVENNLSVRTAELYQLFNKSKMEKEINNEKDLAKKLDLFYSYYDPYGRYDATGSFRPEYDDDNEGLKQTQEALASEKGRKDID